MSTLSELTQAIMDSNRTDAVRLTESVISDEVAPQEILDAMLAGMDDVGRRFKANELFVPEVLLAARAMKESMALLEPLLVKAGIKPKFTAVIGTVQGDLHDVGKNLVSMMWRGANINVVDLGVDVSADQFVDAIRDNEASICGLSALLTTTIPAMKGVIEAIGTASLPSVRVLIGGAPITEEYAEQIGAHGFAPDAASAVDIATRLAAEVSG